MADNVDRREFIKKMIALGFTAAAAAVLYPMLSCKPGEPAATQTPPPVTPAPAGNTKLVIVRGQSPADMVRAALKSLGGMEKFVKKGNDVIIKPNICTGYHTYEYASTTNPEVVATLVTLCKNAGASKVRVMDTPFGGAATKAYEITGIAAAVTKAGGTMEVMSQAKFRETAIPDGRDIKSWKIYGDILDTDVLINVPIAKNHGSTRLTLAMKNLMGVVASPNDFHRNLHQRIADLNTRVRPTLTVIDAVRILLRNGPTGGNLNDVKKTDTIIASTDIVAADAFAATLFGLTAADVYYIKYGDQMGLGTMDLKKIPVEEINV
jgi:uncharacterized protein (DUF362 family)